MKSCQKLRDFCHGDSTSSSSSSWTSYFSSSYASCDRTRGSPYPCPKHGLDLLDGATLCHLHQNAYSQPRRDSSPQNLECLTQDSPSLLYRTFYKTCSLGHPHGWNSRRCHSGTPAAAAASEVNLPPLPDFSDFCGIWCTRV